MALATLTSKGQITIPKIVRDFLRLQAGDKIDFVITKTGDTLLKPKIKTVDAVFGKLHKANNPPPISVETMNTTIKKRLTKKYK